jgi:hypothetical protein
MQSQDQLKLATLQRLCEAFLWRPCAGILQGHSPSGSAEKRGILGPGGRHLSSPVALKKAALTGV